MNLAGNSLDSGQTPWSRLKTYWRARIATPGMTRALRVLSVTFWLLYFAFIALFLTLRYLILPHIENFHGDIERLASARLGQEVRIGSLETRWQGPNPAFILKDLRISGEGSALPLQFPRVEIVVSWRSIPAMALRLDLLSVEGARLSVRRDAQGRLFVAGRAIGKAEAETEPSGNAWADWIFTQRRIQIRDAALTWEDEQRQAPRLELAEINMALNNGWRKHHLGLTLRPPASLGSEMDLRLEWTGRDLKRLTGRAYADMAHADLSAWRPWADLPFDLTQGRGAARAWAGMSEGRLETLTADIALHDAHARWEPELPALDMARLSGRIRLQLRPSGFELEGRELELVQKAPPSKSRQTTPPLKITPLDFHLEWTSADPANPANPGQAGKKMSGRMEIKRADMGALHRLSEYFPLEASWRERLRNYAPRGVLTEVSARWEGDPSRLHTYSLKTGFEGIALNAVGEFPKMTGVSGEIDASERGGKIKLQMGPSAFEARGIFPDTEIRLNNLTASAHWTLREGKLEAELSRAEFSGDATGVARGIYRYSGEGPGYIDMTGTLTQADARAVWRYIPSVVSTDVRYWLRDSLLAGHAEEARLTLKGNLADFPFLDPEKGIFRVTVKARGVTLDYGKAWPEITGIGADLHFEKAGMSIQATHGQIFGANLEATEATIPDFDAKVPMLRVKSKVRGPTPEFLKFIEHSPIAQKIHHSSTIRAAGNGRLSLNLAIPLSEKHLDDSKVEGVYQFQDNQLSFDPDFPPIEKLSGALRFSQEDLHISEISGVFFGGPLKLKGGTQKDGSTRIAFNGTALLSQIRASGMYSSWMSGLSGSSAYKGEVRFHEGNADFFASSSLVGLTSTLPEPFAKPASQRMPFYVERKLLRQTPAGKANPANRLKEKIKEKTPERDQVSATLGDILSLHLVRKKQNNDFDVEFGAVAIEQPLSLSNLDTAALNVSAKQVDLDAWFRFLGKSSAQDVKNPVARSLLPFPVIFRTPQLTFLGRNHGAMEATLVNRGTSWDIALNSRVASGTLLWETEGRDKLTMEMKHLTISTQGKTRAPAENAPPAFAENFKTLPDVDIAIEDFVLNNHSLGRLELQARNDEGFWKLERIQIKNPSAIFIGKAEWRTGGEADRTHVEFRLDSTNIGRLLRRFDYPDIIRGGSAQIEGALAWNGSPVSLDYASLDGKMTLNAERGQFLKIDPGGGKLLGLLSLQSLYRRVSLDFRDIFGQGFTFDSITGNIEAKRGMMHTENLEINGPSARAIIHGETDIQRETQRLGVEIFPEVGGLAALGVAIANPAIGLATLLAHKVMQSPLDQMFSLKYQITGTWTDPKVDKKPEEPREADDPTMPVTP